MERAFIITLRLGAGLAVALWGLSKLLFVKNWVGPYQSVFYSGLPIADVLVYLLGIIQVLIGLAIIFDIVRKPAAWIAVVFSVVNLVVSLATVFQPENPILGNPAPFGIKLIWFFFNPLAITILLISVGLMPPASRRTQSEADEILSSE